MTEHLMVYRGHGFSHVDIEPIRYRDEFFQAQFDLESDLFSNLRQQNDIYPKKINTLSSDETSKVKEFFSKNRDTFFLVLDENKLIGSVLYLSNYIQSLCIHRQHQRLGLGTKLAKYAVNRILASGHSEVSLRVLAGNESALAFYNNIGFKVTQ